LLFFLCLAAAEERPLVGGIGRRLEADITGVLLRRCCALLPEGGGGARRWRPGAWSFSGGRRWKVPSGDSVGPGVGVRVMWSRPWWLPSGTVGVSCSSSSRSLSSREWWPSLVESMVSDVLCVTSATNRKNQSMFWSLRRRPSWREEAVGCRSGLDLRRRRR
jgi:hypothetical protein